MLYEVITHHEAVPGVEQIVDLTPRPRPIDRQRFVSLALRAIRRVDLALELEREVSFNVAALHLAGDTDGRVLDGQPLGAAALDLLV